MTEQRFQPVVKSIVLHQRVNQPRCWYIPWTSPSP